VHVAPLRPLDLNTDGQPAGELPLEFVTTDEHGDCWATLHFNNERWSITDASLIPTNHPDLGWWNIDDPQHPNYTPPVIITAAVAPVPAFIAPAPPPPVQMAAPAAAANGALRGLPPPIFNGDRTQSAGFLLAFCLYKFTNRGHEAMINPATRTTTALSYIAGPLVEAWKEEQLTLLERNIAANVPEGDEAHWTTFQTNFTNAFQYEQEK